MARGLAWGDVRLVEFSAPDKTRPALVLTRTSAVRYLNHVTVAPITSTIRDAPTEVRLGTEHGLKSASAVNLHALQTIDKRRLGRYLGSIPADLRREIRAALLFALDLET